MFEELATAGMGMLGTAQAEIYAAEAIFQELSPEALQSLYDDINQFNLKTVADRRNCFRRKRFLLQKMIRMWSIMGVHF